MSSGKLRPFCLGLNVLSHRLRWFVACLPVFGAKPFTWFIRTNADLLPAEFSETLFSNFFLFFIKMKQFIFKKMNLKMSSAKSWGPFSHL